MSAQPSEVEEYCQVQIKSLNGKWVPATLNMNLSEALERFEALKNNGVKRPIRAVRVHTMYSPFKSTEWGD